MFVGQLSDSPTHDCAWRRVSGTTQASSIGGKMAVEVVQRADLFSGTVRPVRRVFSILSCLHRPFLHKIHQQPALICQIVLGTVFNCTEWCQSGGHWWYTDGNNQGSLPN